MSTEDTALQILLKGIEHGQVVSAGETTEELAESLARAYTAIRKIVQNAHKGG